MSRNVKALDARLSQAQAARLYDRLASVYDLWGRLTESRAQARALELAAIRDGEHVLEVAVGTGMAFAEVVRRNPSGRNVGIDISRGMLAKADRRLRRAGLSAWELKAGSAAAIREPDASFDLVLNNYMFDLLAESEWPVVLTEFRRVLKPGGRLVLVNMTFGERPGTSLYASIYRLSPSLLGGCRSVRFAPVLERAGFRVHSREYCQQMLFPSEVILATSGS